jgi:RNA polymerase sigma-70 factor (ECF subfamily)
MSYDIFGLQSEKQMEVFDFNIVYSLKNGDNEAFSRIYRMSFKPLYDYSYKYLKNNQDAEEIVQNLFLKIWEKRIEINENLSFKSYLFQIASNDVSNLIKKRNIEKRYIDWAQNFMNSFYEVDLNFDGITNADRFIQVHNLINQLPPRRRKIFKMKKIEGRTHHEIANELNLSVRTIENHVLKAMIFIKKRKNMISRTDENLNMHSPIMN